MVGDQFFFSKSTGSLFYFNVERLFSSFRSCQLHHQLEEWADEFGGDFELTVTGVRLTYVTGAEDIRRILLSRPTTFRRGWAPVGYTALLAFGLMLG